MTKTISTLLATSIILGSATFAFADDYTDLAADGIHAPVQILTTKPVALPKSGKAVPAVHNWMDHASQTESGGY